MKLMTMAVITALSVFVVGQDPARAAGQPQCETGPVAGAAPGQEYGAKTGEMAQANVEAKKQADPDKFRTAEAGSATEACPDTPGPAASPAKK